MLKKVWYWIKRALALLLAFMLLWVRLCLRFLSLVMRGL